MCLFAFFSRFPKFFAHRVPLLATRFLDAFPTAGHARQREALIHDGGPFGHADEEVYGVMMRFYALRPVGAATEKRLGSDLEQQCHKDVAGLNETETLLRDASGVRPIVPCRVPRGRAPRAAGNRLLLVMAAIMTVTTMAVPLQASILSGTIFINEIHYDNRGRDVDELIEVAMPVALSTADVLRRLRVTLYNGSTGRPYGPQIALKDFDFDPAADRDGYRFFYRFYSSLQNGAPDGMALAFDSDADGRYEQVQFLSYEGTFTALGGDADGSTSIDIGVAESGSVPAGYSLQLGGTGRRYDEFRWQAARAATPGALNRGQSFAAGRSAVPEPPASTLWWLGILATATVAYRRRCTRCQWRHAIVTAPAAGSGTGVTSSGRVCAASN